MKAELLIPGRMRGPEFYPLVDQRLQGRKLHDSGSLLYSPFPQGIDIFDAQHGDLRERIYLSEQIPRIQEAMAIDETGQRIWPTKKTFPTVRAVVFWF